MAELSVSGLAVISRVGPDRQFKQSALCAGVSTHLNSFWMACRHACL